MVRWHQLNLLTCHLIRVKPAAQTGQGVFLPQQSADSDWPHGTDHTRTDDLDLLSQIRQADSYMLRPWLRLRTNSALDDIRDIALFRLQMNRRNHLAQHDILFPAKNITGTRLPGG